MSKSDVLMDREPNRRTKIGSRASPPPLPSLDPGVLTSLHTVGILDGALGEVIVEETTADTYTPSLRPSLPRHIPSAKEI